MLVILFPLKTMESLQNGVATHFGSTALFSIDFFFAGLSKGAVNRRKLRSQIYDNLVIRTSSPHTQRYRGNRVSAPGLIVTHETLPGKRTINKKAFQ